MLSHSICPQVLSFFCGIIDVPQALIWLVGTALDVPPVYLSLRQHAVFVIVFFIRSHSD